MRYDKAFKVIAILSLGVSMALVAALIIRDSKKTKVAYVDLVMLFNGFDLTKEMSQRLAVTETMTLNALDSIQLEVERGLRNQNVAYESQDVARNRWLLQVGQQRSMALRDSLARSYDQAIWNQLNEYVHEYGNANGYDFIYGSSGSGSIMYANEANYDITEEVLKYINMRYHGN